MNTKILFSVVLASTLMIQGCGQLTKALQDQLAANTTRISGKATLVGASDNSGIIIKMGKQVSASTQSLIMTKSVSLNLVTVAQTGSSGDFSFDVTGKTSAQSLSIQTQSLSLDTGMYTVVFSKDGYESVTVDNVPVILGQSVYNMDAVSLVMDYSGPYFEQIIDSHGVIRITLKNGINIVHLDKTKQYGFAGTGKVVVDTTLNYNIYFGQMFDNDIIWTNPTFVSFIDTLYINVQCDREVLINVCFMIN